MELEEKILICILFDKNFDKKDINKIDLKLFTKISSSHLMLPALYFHIKKKKLEFLFPDDFIDYIKKIFLINQNRNKKLLSEIEILRKIFDRNKIDYVFLKGTAMLVANDFEDIGVRMIGDIDLLTYEKNANETFKILKSEGYFNKDHCFFPEKNKHFEKQSKKNHLFAIEVHKRLFDKRKYEKFLKSNDVIKNKIKVSKYKIPCLEHRFLHSVYNHQITDMGYIKMNYNLRSYYDTYRLNIKLKNKNEIKRNKIINSYIYFGNKLKIFNEQVRVNKLTAMKYKMISGRYLGQKVYSFLITTFIYIRNLENLPDQFFEFLKNRNYRRYSVNKIFTFFQKLFA